MISRRTIPKAALSAALVLMITRAVPAAELMLHWPLDEPHDLIVRDVSGNVRDGRLEEGSRHHRGPRFAPGAGWSAGAVQMGSRFAIIADEELALPERFTLSYFILKPVRTGENRNWVDLGGMQLQIRGSEAFLVVPELGRFTIPRQTAGRWEHVAVVVEPGRIQVYVNGGPALEQSKDGWRFPDKAALRITATGGGYNEYIDEIRLYAGVLEASDVAALAVGLYRPDAPWIAGLDKPLAALTHELKPNQPELEHLRKLGAPSVPALIKTLEGDADLGDLTLAVRALGVLKGDRARDALIAMTGREQALIEKTIAAKVKENMLPHESMAIRAAIVLEAAELQEAVMEALGRIGYAGAIPLFIEQFAHSNEHVRAAARRSMVGLGETGVPVLRNGLLDTRSAVAWGAATALDELKVEPADATEALRRQIALRQWDRIRSADCADPLPLAETLSSDDSMQVAFASNELILRGEGVLEVTAPVLQSGTPGARRAAARVLGLLADPRAAGPLAAQLGDEDALVQQACAEALRYVAGEGQVNALTRVLESPNGPSREAAMITLAEIGEPALKALRSTLKKGSPVARKHAAEALGLMAAQQAADGLQAAAHDPEFAVRAAAIDALGRLPSPPFEPLKNALNDSDWLVRRQAVMALRRLNTHAARQELPKIQDDPYPLVRGALTDDLSDLRALVPVDRLRMVAQSEITAERIALSPLDAVRGEGTEGGWDARNQAYAGLGWRAPGRLFWQFTAPASGLYRVQAVQTRAQGPVRQEIRFSGRPGVMVFQGMTLAANPIIPVVAGMVRLREGELFTVDYEIGGGANVSMKAIELIKVGSN